MDKGMISEEELNTLIEQCKHDIIRKADRIGMVYDDLDIVSIKTKWGTVVALQEATEFPGHKDPVKIPNMMLIRGEPQIYSLDLVPGALGYVPMPSITCRWPHLVHIILPDGTVKRNDTWTK